MTEWQIETAGFYALLLDEDHIDDDCDDDDDDDADDDDDDDDVLPSISHQISTSRSLIQPGWGLN